MALTHDELCQIACRFLQNNGFKVAFHDRFVAYVGTGEQPDAWAAGWNACRAAMLQAGTLTNEGTKQAWTGIPDIDNAINMLDRIDTLESCDDDRIEAVKTVLRRLAGNSPVIPEGYVMVPKEPTPEMLEVINEAIKSMRGSAATYARVLAAAPQEVK